MTMQALTWLMQVEKNDGQEIVDGHTHARNLYERKGCFV